MLKSIEELRAYRAEAKAAMDSENRKIIICGGAGCVSKGANKVYERLLALLEEKGIKFNVKLEKCSDGDPVRVTKSGCHGFVKLVRSFVLNLKVGYTLKLNRKIVKISLLTLS